VAVALAEVISERLDRRRSAESSRPPMIFRVGAGPTQQGMRSALPNPVVHLELRTANLPRACVFYTRLFGWHAESVHTGSGDYLALDLGERIEGGIVEHNAERPFWLPYVEVPDLVAATERARFLGASVLLSPREGPAGWRSVVAVPAGGEIALWQPKGP
jgi:predicted enzyme related to lactoylglutathione lyase